MTHLDLDVRPPYCLTRPHNNPQAETTRIEIPEPLACYLTVHDIGGGKRMRAYLEFDEALRFQREVRSSIPTATSELLGLHEFKEMSPPKKPTEHPEKLPPYDTQDASIVIPPNHFVWRFNSDSEKPEIEVANKEGHLPEGITSPIPLALVHYLSTKGCGSLRNETRIRQGARRAAQTALGEALGLERI
jgi:hypothetical protein